MFFRTVLNLLLFLCQDVARSDPARCQRCIKCEKLHEKVEAWHQVPKQVEASNGCKNKLEQASGERESWSVAWNARAKLRHGIKCKAMQSKCKRQLKRSIK